MQGVTHAANGKSAHEYFSELSCLTKPEGALAFDLIYNPQDTAFMACARNHGFRAVGGLPMLVDQAMAAWDIWNEITESSEQDPSIRNRLLAHLREMFREEAKARTIFLTGFMGVGKSVVAAELGKKLKRSHVDTDRLIEQKAGLSISEIFSQMGEDYFRNLEKQTIIELAAEPGRVVALGGGALVNPESLAVVKKRGLLVFLDAEIEALDRRLQRTASLRPLLAGLTPDQRLEKMNNLLAERMPIYLQAEIQIKTDDHRPDEVADLILKKISENLAVSS
jgi:shikimate kinase